MNQGQNENSAWAKRLERQNTGWFWLAAAGFFFVLVMFLVAAVVLFGGESVSPLSSHGAAVSEAPQEVQSVQRDVAVLDARMRATVGKVDSLSLVLIAISIGFGSLITVVVIFFALSSREAAVAAAREGVEEQWPRLEKRLTERADDKIEETESRVRILEHRVRRQHERLSENRDLTQPLTGKQRDEIEEEAQDVLAIPAVDRSSGDWRVLAFYYSGRGDDADAYIATSNAFEVAQGDFEKARALSNKGVALDLLGQHHYAIRSFEDVDRLFGGSMETAVREQVAKALGKKGTALLSLGRPSDVLDTSEEVLQRFRDSDDEGVLVGVALALFNKAVALGELDRNEEAIYTYNELHESFGDSSDAFINEIINKGLLNKGLSLRAVHKYEEAIDTFDKVKDQCDDSTDEDTEELRSEALLNKGLTQKDFDKNGEAMGTFEEVRERYVGSKVARVQECVAEALLREAELLVSDDVSGACDKAREAEGRVTNLTTDKAKDLRGEIREFLKSNCE